MASSTNIKIPEALQGPLETIRRRQTRTAAGQILHYVREGLVRDGFTIPDAPIDEGRDGDEATP